MRIVVRADGGPEIGYGHLTRARAVADAAQAAGHDVVLATTTPDAATDIWPFGTTVQKLTRRTDADEFLTAMDPGAVDVVYCDAHVLGTEYQQTVRAEVPLAIFQDNPQYAICADAFINGNLYAETMSYRTVGADPEWCLGTEYVLLREPIKSLIGDDAHRQNLERAVVTMGGSDPGRYTATALQAFAGTDLAVDVIVGPGFEEVPALQSVLGDTETIRLHRNPEQLPELFRDADFAVTACGATVYELFALGTACIAIPQVPNQRPLGERLDSRDLALVLLVDTGVDTLRSHIKALRTDHELRRRLQRQGESLVDGGGAERVLKTLERIASG